jgi:cation diffusion facilitator family transporter
MVLEITFGLTYGSLAVLSDGIHMSTHVLAFVITWLAYSFSRRYSEDPRFVFGTGKVGDLAAFTSAIILFMIALIIFYDGVRCVFGYFQCSPAL